MTIMMVLLIMSQAKTLEVRFTDIAPRIDGVLDEIWLQADSACDFVQCEPYEKIKSTDKTTVYALQDENNLFFAFVCYADSHRIISNLTKEEDIVAIGIDPFGSKTSGYYFSLCASGIIDDGWILDDGRTYDSSWDGVWYKALKVYPDRYVAEFRIPFKSIRYKTGLSEWGVQFKRFIAENRETDYWTETLQIEGDMISKWPIMTGVNPQAQGYYFELYPEGYVRTDHDWYYSDTLTTDSTEFKPSISLNLKWDITPQTTLNGTVYPDFAQIESDPYTLNLGRYETYLDERRPFFLEGNDIFRMSDFGESKGFFTPLQLFYSRRVGRSINGDAVPIIGGIKLTGKSDLWNYGILSTYTGEYTRGDTVIENEKSYSALRIKRRILQNSDIGVLLSSEAVNKDSHNVALGIDCVYRKGFNQYIIQGAASDQNGKQGWAFSSGLLGFFGKFLTLGGISAISDSFDVNNIGFVPWVGEQKLLLMSGPYVQYPKGLLQNLFIAPGIALIKEGGSNDWSKIGIFEFNPNLRNNWGCDFSLDAGPYYEADTHYFYRSLNLSVWGNMLGQHVEFGTHYGYSYNYRRGFLANQNSNYLTYNYSIIEPLRVGLNANCWIEWDSSNSFLAVTPRLRPNIWIWISSNMSLTLFGECVLYDEANDSERMRLANVRTGALFSWNFLPKSWIYIALNDFRTEISEPGRMEPLYQIGAVKAKYLLYF